MKQLFFVLSILLIARSIACYDLDDLKEAIENKDLEEITKIVTQDKNLLEKEDQLGRTPLHYAIEKSFDKGIVYLLDQGANIVAKDEQEQTPLHLALERYAQKLDNLYPNTIDQSNMRDIIMLLVERGAPQVLHEVDNKLLTPAQYAQKRKSIMSRGREPMQDIITLLNLAELSSDLHLLSQKL